MLFISVEGRETLRAPKLPLPSVCSICRTTIHAALIRNTSRGEHTFSRKQTVIWFHDAPLPVVLRKGGAHDAIPDPSYQPQRARVVGPVTVSAVEATRDWRITPVVA
jgi:hypothetical protein